jgi:hypothetical protein
MLRSALFAGVALLAIASSAFAVPSANKSAAPAKAPADVSPSWAQLTPDQKEALSPLQADWDKYDAPRKKKWLDIAARYKDLSPEGQQKMHERMPDLAKLTPEQRRTARENFKRAYSLPPDQRKQLTEQFQNLPEEKKRELAEEARKKPGPPPRRTTTAKAPNPSGQASAPQAGTAAGARPATDVTTLPAANP